MNSNTTTRTAFQADTTYKMRFIGDSDLIAPVTVLKRTEKTVTVSIRGEAAKSCRIKTDHNGIEYILPLGSYSMAPCVKADRLF